MTPDLTTEEIYEHYRELVAKYVTTSGLVLKTDCYNEANGGIIGIEGVGLGGDWTTYVELDPGVIQRARERHPLRHFVQGDIRDLSFLDSQYDTVVDLSTLDHIPPMDVPTAVREYYRVLAGGGNLILVCWCSDELQREPVDWGGPQYFHDEGELKEALETAGFDFIHWAEFHRAGGLYLVEVVAEKREPC